MELDDLRRRWQQQPVVPAVPTQSPEPTLRAMLSLTPNTPLSHLKHNTRRNLVVGLLLLVINLRGILGQGSQHGIMHEPLMRGLFLAGFLMLFASLLWQLWLFRRMERVSDNLCQQLRNLTEQVKRLLRLRELTGPIWYSLLVLAAIYLKRSALLAYLQADGQQLFHALLVGAGLLLLVGLGLGLHWLGKRQKQRRYGQYIDRLEAALRELEA
jgi:hypothetical protein